MNYRNSTFTIKPRGRKRLDVPGERKRIGRRVNPLERKWRKAVLDRDQLICRKCGLLGTKSMDAHHIAPRSRRPDLVLELSNGAALHRQCHMLVHANPLESTAAGLLSTETYEKAQKERAVAWALI